MRTLKFLLQKEFRQIFRNPSILRIIFVMPMIQLIILPWAADYEMKNINVAVVDHDHSSYTQLLMAKLSASTYFKVVSYNNSYKNAYELIEKDKADLILEIPINFEKNLVRNNEEDMFIAINAINGAKANLGGAYLQNLLMDFNREIRLKWIQFPKINPEPTIEISSSNWFNPLLNYKFFMVPGILVILLTMIGANLSALNIVREKEIGTIEQINVTPISKFHFILGKLIPFWIIGLVVLTLGLTLARVLYGILPLGSYFTIYVFAAIYLLAVLGLGLLVSTYAHNQQQAMLISFFLMMVFILLGGLYTSIDSMPTWAQYVTKFNPVTYFIEVMRMVVLKGSNLLDIKNQIITMALFAVVLNSWAVMNYRKRS